MKTPVTIKFPTIFTEELRITTFCPPDGKYNLQFANTLHTSYLTGEFTVQSVDGTDYWLELWTFSVKTNELLEVIVPEPIISVALFLQGNLEGELAGYGKVYSFEKTINVFYIPAGKHQIHLKQGEYQLLYFIPPDNSFEGMSVEHPGIKELINRQSQKNTNGMLLNGFPLPKDVWMKLKRMETISQNLFALDLPLRQYMLELLNYYSAELRKHKSSLPVNSSSRDKALALQNYILTNLHDPALGSLDKLAKRFHLSIKSLTKEFKELTGMTIHQYIVDQRLEFANQLLQDTQTPLIDIVTASGFTGSSHFIKNFNKKYGYTPNQYKKC